ncbi:hypothetical protein O6H91_01G140100 [Diphasiastrum complanatum]|uniref:Uncharacterized protein n=2 Tax=Diphasiastrum complanatum TaxID=34168 RepID=A0ACC2EX37_DIPCM|nr:hypothetical protein O6H91_01G140100 [Diphasiastrum complanatum]KAJ7570926.1 hypothetical protein O6H91_01G140100 [Diphasiastrum complanatum]
MYQWRKFQFFEEKAVGEGEAGAAEELLKEKIVCSSSGRGQIVLGAEDAMVHVLDRSLKLTYSFQAHSTSVFFIQQLKQRNVLISIGEDETSTPEMPAMSLKMWDLEKIQPEGSSTTGPACIRTLRIFTSKFPEAKISSCLIYEEAPPILLVSIGLDTGVIYTIRGDIARERIARSKLVVDSSSNNNAASPVTGLAFRADGQALQLFVITTTSINLFDMNQQPPYKHVLDEHGCEGHSVTMNDKQELVVGRDEAVYFYEIDGRGPCWAFEGKKRFLGWFRGYLLAVVADQRNSDRNVFNIYDLKNKLIAYSAPVGDVAHVLCEWGIITILTRDHQILTIGEKDMGSKLEMLFRKNLYTVAINLVQSQQADAVATAEVMRKYGDHLYGKQDYDEAMAQYIRTIGHLEPSYVIQKFLDAQRIHNLTHYLEKLHEKRLATADHTTLLLNCYTKLKDIAKLDEFIKGNEGTEGERHFDVETAVKVCRGAGYYQHALYVAKKAGEHEWYLKILLEDLGRHNEALQYIGSLSIYERVLTLKQYGKILVQHKPAETTVALMKLCTNDTSNIASGQVSKGFGSIVPSPIDFVHIYVDQPKWLMIFLESYIGKIKDSPVSIEINNTLLELYLSEDLRVPSLLQLLDRSPDHTEGSAKKKSVKNQKSNGFVDKIPMDSKKVENGAVDVKGETNEEKTERRKKGLDLLKRGWGIDDEKPSYDADLAVVLCEIHRFREGLLFLYEKMKLYKEVMACYMQDADYPGLISCCKRLGDASRGGDSSLWADVLAYFGEHGENCCDEVKEILVYIERDNLLPPLIVLQMLAKNQTLTLSVVKDYIARQLQEESRLIEEDRRAIEKYQEETVTMRAEVRELQSSARIFQLSKCTACTSALDLPAVHFLCMHSFHQRCLGDNERECPICAPANRTLIEMKRSLEQNANDHDRFFQLVQNSDDGFSVIAEYFGRGVLNNAQKAAASASSATLNSH